MPQQCGAQPFQVRGLYDAWQLPNRLANDDQGSIALPYSRLAAEAYDAQLCILFPIPIGSSLNQAAEARFTLTEGFLDPPAFSFTFEIRESECDILDYALQWSQGLFVDCGDVIRVEDEDTDGCSRCTSGIAALDGTPRSRAAGGGGRSVR